MKSWQIKSWFYRLRLLYFWYVLFYTILNFNNFLIVHQLHNLNNSLQSEKMNAVRVCFLIFSLGNTGFNLMSLAAPLTSMLCSVLQFYFTYDRLHKFNYPALKWMGSAYASLAFFQTSFHNCLRIVEKKTPVV